MARDVLVTDVGAQAYLVYLVGDALYFVPGAYTFGIFLYAPDTQTKNVLAAAVRNRLYPLEQNEAAVRRLISVYLKIGLAQGAVG